MNQQRAENEFLNDLKKLLEDFRRSVDPKSSLEFSGAEPGSPLEHTVRINLHDELLQLLGWNLGLGGNVAEEARIKDETTTYIDYLGVNPATKAPVLLWESKAWDKPFVTASRKAVMFERPRDLIISGIHHVLDHKTAATSPAGAAWHGHLEQVEGYVRRLKTKYNHALPRAVLSNGQWLVIFTQPFKTFVLGEVSAEDVETYEFDDYLKVGKTLFRLLSRDVLGPTVPYPLRPGQLGEYIDGANVTAAFHSVHVSYEKSGTHHFSTKPRVTVYPAVTILRGDGALLTAFEDDGLVLDYKAGFDDAPLSLGQHLSEVDKASAIILGKCSQAVGANLQPATLSDFPGFSDRTTPDLGSRRRRYVQPEAEPDLWLLITGEHRHFLRATPVSAGCAFHLWANCRKVGEAIGDSAVSVRQTESPRTFFTDDEPHHCAHQGLNDRRDSRCQIGAIDQRICCQACVYVEVCWEADEQLTLPCAGQAVAAAPAT